MSNGNNISIEKKLSPEEIAKLINAVNEVETEVENNFSEIKKKKVDPNNMTVTLLIGPTGSGKTTLYYALTNKELKGKKEGRKKYLEATKPIQNFKIGNDGLSETTTPGLEFYDNKIICDCPGFFDNRGDIQDIANSFAIHRVLNSVKKVKILLVSSINDIEGSKGLAIRNSCLLIEKLIPDTKFLYSCVGLVITHVNPSELNELFLDNIETKGCRLLNNFQSRETGNKKIVFKFPLPTDTNNQVYSGFNDKKNIIDFINEETRTFVAPFVSLSSEAKLMILSGVGSFGCLSNCLQRFAERIMVDSSISDNDLDMWSNRVDKLITTTYSDPKDFVDKAKTFIVPITNAYNDIYNDIMKIHFWRQFLEKIAKNDMSDTDQVIARNSELMKPVFLDISPFLSEILTPNKAIIQGKIEAHEIQIKKDKTIQEQQEYLKLMDKLAKEERDAKEAAIRRELEAKIKYEQEQRKFAEEMARRNSGGNNGGRGGGFFSKLFGGCTIF